MAAQHRDNPAPSCRRHDLIDDETQILRGENRRERVEERGERAVSGKRCMGKERGIDFVGAFGDGNGLEAGEVGFAVIGHG